MKNFWLLKQISKKRILRPFLATIFHSTKYAFQRIKCRRSKRNEVSGQIIAANNNQQNKDSEISLFDRNRLKHIKY